MYALNMELFTDKLTQGFRLQCEVSQCAYSIAYCYVDNSWTGHCYIDKKHQGKLIIKDIPDYIEQLKKHNYTDDAHVFTVFLELFHELEKIQRVDVSTLQNFMHEMTQGKHINSNYFLGAEKFSIESDRLH